MKAKLTTKTVKASKAASKAYKVYDDTLPGFLLRVQPSGYRCYYVEFRQGNARKQTHRIGPADRITVAQARDAASRFIAAVTLGNDPHGAARRAKAKSLDLFLKDVYEPWATVHLKTGTAICAQLRGAFGSLLRKGLGQLTPFDIEKWRNARHTNGASPSTSNRDLTYLNALLTRAVEWGFIDVHPLRGKVKKAREDTSRVRFLSPDEERRLLDALDTREQTLRDERARYNVWRKERNFRPLQDLTHTAFADYLKPMVLLSLDTGLRRGELFSLEWRDVFFGTETRHAHLNIRPETTKTGKGRRVGLCARAVETLKGWREQTKGDGLVFRSPQTGKRFDNVTTSWAAAVAEAKIDDFRWHDMRHHFASRLVQRGVDLYQVKAALGHSSVAQTERYAHLRPESVLSAVDALDREPTNIVLFTAAEAGSR